MLAISLPHLWHLSVTKSSVALPPHTSRFAMDRYIHEQNLAHYRKVLSEKNNPTTRHTVLKLLADEQATTQVPTEVPALAKSRGRITAVAKRRQGGCWHQLIGAILRRRCADQAGQPDKLRRIDNFPKCWAWKAELVAELDAGILESGTLDSKNRIVGRRPLRAAGSGRPPKLASPLMTATSRRLRARWAELVSQKDGWDK